ncbi:MAG: hypothetical protein JSV04_12780 [Candidatus Heimdallarchaeota archaeon]|nr:MAG: hypothetical protein JSV04_12780 [Candidatus Heimdallarchaeota archaeon]
MYYNLLTGENTVLQGLVAEEFARYILSQRFPILIIRPTTALKYLENSDIRGKYIDFLTRNQKTMDFFGIFPFSHDEEYQFTPEEIVCQFFYEKEGLNRYLNKNSLAKLLRGFIIEVKSRATRNSWAPFQFSLSKNQSKLVNQSQRFNFDIILCGVTFTDDWNLSVVFYDRNQKILSNDFFYKSINIG